MIGDLMAATRMVLRNWRGFDEAGAAVDLTRHFTGLVGTNNSGKTTLVRALFELRPLLTSFSAQFSQNPQPLVAGYGQPQLQPGERITPVHDPAARPSAAIDFESQDDPVLSKHGVLPVVQVIFQPLQNGLWGVVMRVSDGSVIDSTATLGTMGVEGQTAFQATLNDGRSVLVDLGGLKPGLDQLANSLYVGAFRNALSGGGATYYDLSIGKDFVASFDQSLNGVDFASNEAVKKMIREVGEILGLRDFDVRVSPNKEQLNYFVGDRSLRGSELGAGVAQFLVVAASVLVKRPNWLLIDEPELNLHARMQEGFLTLLGRHVGTGVIFSTHSFGLARSMSDQLIVCRRTESGTAAARYEKTSDLSLALGELGFGGMFDLAHRAVLLVEGQSEVKAFRAILRWYGIADQVVVLSLGGSSGISAHRDAELLELRRLADIVFAVIDSERTSESEALAKARSGFASSCKEIGIDCLVLERRAFENYLDQEVARRVLGKPDAASFGLYDKPSEDWSWPKDRNWLVADGMPKSGIEETDLGKHLGRLAAALSKIE
jgi:energy-coupling factor transporter ATP-binding protein EcfA2